MGMVPPRILRPRAKPDYTLLEGARAYGPVKQLSKSRGYQPSSPEPEQNPPQSVSGIIPYKSSWIEKAARIDRAIHNPMPGQITYENRWTILDPSIIRALLACGYRCEQVHGNTYATDITIENSKSLTLPGDVTIERWGMMLVTPEVRAREMPGWMGMHRVEPDPDLLYQVGMQRSALHDRDGWDCYNIHNPDVIDALKRNGYQCEQYHGSPIRFSVNLLFEHNVPRTLRDGTTLVRHGAVLETPEEFEAYLQEALDSTSEPASVFSDGIEPCGYDEL